MPAHPTRGHEVSKNLVNWLTSTSTGWLGNGYYVLQRWVLLCGSLFQLQLYPTCWSLAILKSKVNGKPFVWSLTGITNLLQNCYISVWISIHISFHFFQLWFRFKSHFLQHHSSVWVVGLSTACKKIIINGEIDKTSMQKTKFEWYIKLEMSVTIILEINSSCDQIPWDYWGVFTRIYD